MRRAAVLAVLSGCWLAVALLGAPPALAHAQVVATGPVEGARLTTTPDHVSVTFSENVSLAAGYLRVVDQVGRPVSDGAVYRPDEGETQVAVRLRPGLGNGSYLVSYSVVSADSHPVRGAFAFVVGDGPLLTSSGAVGDSRGTDRAVAVTFGAARWVSYGGLVLLGGLVFVCCCWPAGRGDGRARRLVLAGPPVTAVAAVASVLLEGPYAAGAGLTSALSPALLGATLSLPYGRLLVVRLCAAGALAMLTRRLLDDRDAAARTRPRDTNLALAAGFVVLVTFAAAGHAVAGSFPTATVLVEVVHLAAMAVWLGGLVMLAGCLLPSGAPEDLATVLPRFSVVAASAVAALAVTGTFQAWREVGWSPALWSTGYGRLLMLKVGGVGLLLLLGNASRLAVHRGRGGSGLSGGSGGSPGSGRLRRTVAAEAAIGGVVLALTAALVAMAPARSSYVRQIRTTVSLGSGTAALSVEPGRVGSNSLRLDLRDRAGNPVEPREVRLTAELPGQHLGPLPATLNRIDPGGYRVAALLLPRAGRWELTVRCRVSDFDEDVAVATIAVGDR